MPAFRPSRSAIVKTSLLLSLPVGLVLLVPERGPSKAPAVPE